MGITSAIVLFAVIWFLVLLIILPLRLQTQGDLGKVESGTHAGSPEKPADEKALFGHNCSSFDYLDNCGGQYFKWVVFSKRL